MNEAVICGIGMTQFGKFLHKGLKQLALEAVSEAIADAGISKSDIQAAYVGNSVAGLVTGQETIRGQVVLRAAGIGGIPIFNVENACASSSTALHLGALAVQSGIYDCVLAVGVEKMTHPDRSVTFKAFEGGVDVEEMQDVLRNSKGTHSVFMDLYAQKTKKYMEQFGITKKQLAMVASKNHTNGSLNPLAQRTNPLTVEDVLNDRLVTEPFTRYMCSPVSDGAAAVVLCSKEYAKKLTSKPVFIAASAVLSASADPKDEGNVIRRTAENAYKMAGFGSEEISVFEVHDATASAELMAYEELGLCRQGEGGKLIEERMTYIGGKMPVNTSGGLEAKGHPVGATGLGQIYELVLQLRGDAGPRQVDNPKAALAQNAGGMIGEENATASITILKI